MHRVYRYGSNLPLIAPGAVDPLAPTIIPIFGQAVCLIEGRCGPAAPNSWRIDILQGQKANGTQSIKQAIVCTAAAPVNQAVIVTGEVGGLVLTNVAAFGAVADRPEILVTMVRDGEQT
jgi:hypothetical protein